MISRLIHLMRPSDSGKDSLLQTACEPLALRGCHIVRWAITRSAEVVGEDAQAVTPMQFDTLERASALAISWCANGLCYGAPVQIDERLAQGYDVLVNGSRGYLTQARRRYSDLLVVPFGVKPKMLRQRLLARGRESPEEIEARPAHNAEFAAGLEGSLFQLDNSGDLDDTLRSLPTRFGSNHACA